MSDYFFRKVEDHRYEVAKFDGHKRPDVVYTVTDNGACTCPQGHGCRHSVMLDMLRRQNLLDTPGCIEYETRKFYRIR